MWIRLQQITIVVVMMVLLVAGLTFAQGKVDINTADIEQLMSLKGIGEQKAQAIIKYRQTHGPFQSLDDLQNVPGIGAKTVVNNQGMITIGAMQPGEEATTGATEKPKKDIADTAKKAKQVHSAK